jgi:hypothetical protein
MLAYHAHVERLPETQHKCQEDAGARKAWGILRKAREVALIQESIVSELEKIQFAAFDIPEFAIEGLLEVASNAIEVLESVAEKHPGSARQSARKRESWPVLASRSRKVFSVIQERLHALKLGEGVSKPADVKASDSTARHYAQAVYDTLTENQSLHVFIRRIYEDPDWLGTPVNAPKWATGCAALPTFNRKNFKAWWKVAEAMLKDQCPDLVDRPEWANTTRHSICRTDFGKLRRGTAQSRILGKIKDALHNLAPE